MTLDRDPDAHQLESTEAAPGLAARARAAAKPDAGPVRIHASPRRSIELVRDAERGYGLRIRRAGDGNNPQRYRWFSDPAAFEASAAECIDTLDAPAEQVESRVLEAVSGVRDAMGRDGRITEASPEYETLLRAVEDLTPKG